MDHSYSTNRERHLWKDHSYFSVGKKTPKVISQKAQLLKEQQTGEQGSGWQDHTYTRFNPKLIPVADKENSSILPGSQQKFDSEGNLIRFSARDGSVGEGIIGIGATETIGVIKIEPEAINLEPAIPAFRRPDHTYMHDLYKEKPTASSKSHLPKVPAQSRSDHSYFGKVTNETEVQKNARLATVINRSEFYKVKDHSYIGRGGMVVKEEPD